MMLTFRFTGASGEMIEKGMLVSGMVGMQVKFEFSEEWDGLRKAAVYRAGDIVCTDLDIQGVNTIPELVLSKSLRRLYVGVYGISEDGQVAIPTRFVPGPFIHIGTSTDEDSGFDRDDPFWMEMEQALEETVRFTPQELTEEQMAQARANIGVAGGGGMNPVAAALLLSILRKAAYTEDVSEMLLALEQAMAQSDEEQEVWNTLTCSLENVTAQPETAEVKAGESCTVTLIAADGYVLDTVSVTMGGSDITASVYSGGIVTIPVVTGNVVVNAKAVVQAAEPEGTYEIMYVSASVFDGVMNNYFDPSKRMTAAITDVVADTPFPQSGAVYDGDLYLLPVPAGTSALNVTSPGLIGWPLFFTLKDGVYTCELDATWQTIDSFSYTYTADAYDFVAINFKNETNTEFFTEDYDTSGIVIEFTTPDSGDDGTEEDGETVETYPVTMSFTQLSSGNNQRTVEKGATYKNILIPADGYVLTSVTVTMGGVDVTASACSGTKITIENVTGAVFITAVAMRGTGDIVFMPASASAETMDAKNPRTRMCTAKLTGEVPFPQNGTVYSGDLYPVPVPAEAAALDVTCPGLIGGIQFYNLADGAYTNVLDTGWQTLDSFSYTLEAGAYGYCIINFKNSDNTEFFTSDYDTSGITITFQ